MLKETSILIALITLTATSARAQTLAGINATMGIMSTLQGMSGSAGISAARRGANNLQTTVANRNNYINGLINQDPGGQNGAAANGQGGTGQSATTTTATSGRAPAIDPTTGLPSSSRPSATTGRAPSVNSTTGLPTSGANPVQNTARPLTGNPATGSANGATGRPAAGLPGANGNNNNTTTTTGGASGGTRQANRPTHNGYAKGVADHASITQPVFGKQVLRTPHRTFIPPATGTAGRRWLRLGTR